MIRKTLFFVFILLLLFCGGCWNYRGLDEMSIVSGLAIDYGNSGDFKVSFQIVDLTGNVKVEGINSKLLESEGKTLFDACRNAKRNIIGKLYFGHTQLALISEKMAREKDLSALISWMLHDSEMRETLKLVISKEATAKDILSNETLVGPIVAFEVSTYLQEDNKITSSTPYIQLYEVYNALESEGVDLALPAIHNVKSGDRTIAQLCGTAIFKGERLAGYIDSEESKYYLFAIDKVKGGLLTFPADGEGKDDITLEISDNRTSRSFTDQDGKLVMLLNTETNVFLAEHNVPVEASDKQQIEKLETNAAKTLAQRMVKSIQDVQGRFGADIFGFGRLVHKQDKQLWEKIKSQWDDIFPTLEVRVNAKVNIINSALIS